MKTPDEIKKGLECCTPRWVANHWKSCSSKCPYITLSAWCRGNLVYDSLTYIHQLENQIGELTEKVEQIKSELPRWISVEERLPDNNGNFITKIHCEKGDWIEFDTFDHTEKEWWHDTGNRVVEATEFVTHWIPMPIPEPPKD